MRITFGRGRNRKTTEIATGPHMDKAQRDKSAWELKQILFNLGIIDALA